MRNRSMWFGAAALCALLAASCGPQADKTTPPKQGGPDEAANAAAPADNIVEAEAEGKRQPRSVLRPDIAPPKPEPPAIAPIHAVVSFGASPFALDEAGRTTIDALFDKPAVKSGGAIVLRGHSDSRGSDGDNRAASRVRAERVRDYLIEKGIVPERITLIGLGETRPVAPNAMPDGTDDPEGRAKNRRVDIDVAGTEAAGSGEVADPNRSVE